MELTNFNNMFYNRLNNVLFVEVKHETIRRMEVDNLQAATEML